MVSSKCCTFAPQIMNTMLKRLYNWVLSWSESRWGWLALFIIALFEASWFPLPPDVLLIALCLGATKKSFRFASICLVGSILGAALGYWIGSAMWITGGGEPTALASFFYDNIFSVEKFSEVGTLYDKYNFWIVFTAGFTPVPFKIFTIAGGVFHINFAMFIFASIISRGLRFFLIAWLIWRYGAPIKSFIDKYFNLLASLLTLIIIAIAALIYYFTKEDGNTELTEAQTEITTTLTSHESNNNDITTIEQCDTLR